MHRTTTLLAFVAPIALAACDSPGGGGGRAPLDCNATPNVPACQDTRNDTSSGDTTTDTTSPDTNPADTNPADTNPADTNPVDTNPADTVGPASYYAVIVDDSKVFPNHRSAGINPCSTASAPLYAHGAGIDAVGLFDGATLVGYFDVVDYKEGGICDGSTGSPRNTMIDETLALGPPDARLDRGFVSLGGGFLIGEFDNAARIMPGDTIVVYEVGKRCGSNTNCGGLDEGYEVFLAEDLDCVNVSNGYPYTACAKKLSDSAKGEATIPVSGF